MKPALLAAAVALLAASAFAAEPVTFNKHIAPIVLAKCAGCHRPGEVGPFSLLTYRDLAKRAGQIEEVTAGKRMPPWKPVVGHGQFKGDRSLSAEEIALIKAWVESGAAEGDAQDLPPAPQFPTGWQLGEPDVVLTMPEAVQIPAEGRDVYVNVVLPVQIPTGKYLRAVEYRPGNRRIVHHAGFFFDTKGEARKRDAETPEPGFVSVTPVGQRLPGPLVVWTPGRNPTPLPDDMAFAWPSGADLVINLHLHPSGKPESERSSLGLFLTDKPPQRAMFDVTLIDTKIDIPPGERAFRTSASKTLEADADLLSIFPHMHMIGKEIKVTATLPGGEEQPLFWINDWDFNWQDAYEYAQPVRLPKGTKLTLTGIHDNSADNPHNPSSPPARVRWGEQTLNEMSIAFLNLARVGSAGEPGKPAAPVDFARRATDALAKVDKDKNGKLSLDEILAAVGDKEPRDKIVAALAKFDRDGDKELNAEETAEALKAQAQR